MFREFIGPVILVVTLPLILHGLVRCMLDPQLDSSIVNLFLSPTRGFSEFRFSVEQLVHAVGLLFGFMCLQLTILLLMPGTKFKGPVAPSGHTPQYVDNAFQSFVATWLCLAFGAVAKLYPVGIIYDILEPLMIILNVLALAISSFCYVKGIYFPSTKDCDSSGGFWIDFYWGRELYPRVFGVDLKQFLICRVGMMLWLVFVVSFAFKTGEIQGTISKGQMVSAGLQFGYIAKFYWWEKWYLHAADIHVDRFGFMLIWGPLCFMPFVHSLENLYLVRNRGLSMSTGFAWFCFILGCFGTWCNYESDTQRHRVRQNPKSLVWGKPAKTIIAKYTTADGVERTNLLLYSGFNGVSRHFHYVPDIMNLILYCLPTGFSRVLPWLYCIYLSSLLIDRTYRIDEKCHKKYGKYWEQYCQKVPYKLIPYVW
jgi:7-dehydrocholesterol reductase